MSSSITTGAFRKDNEGRRILRDVWEGGEERRFFGELAHWIVRKTSFSACREERGGGESRCYTSQMRRKCSSERRGGRKGLFEERRNRVAIKKGEVECREKKKILFEGGGKRKGKGNSGKVESLLWSLWN